MFKFFIDHANRVGERILNGERACALWDRLALALGDVLVYAPLQEPLRAHRSIKVGYTAGEAIGPEIFRFYRSIGVNLKQLYGQTEASVYITMQPDGEIRADTVGRPAPQVEIRIDDNGEVLYRSPGVFLGYYKDEAKTAETKTAGRLRALGRRRLLRRRPATSRSSTAPRTSAGCGTARSSRRNTSRTS